jgi:hypothetical protein
LGGEYYNPPLAPPNLGGGYYIRNLAHSSWEEISDFLFVVGWLITMLVGIVIVKAG